MEIAAIDADDDKVGGREAAVKLKLPLHILVLAIGHHQTPEDTCSWRAAGARQFPERSRGGRQLKAVAGSRERWRWRWQDPAASI